MSTKPQKPKEPRIETIEEIGEDLATVVCALAEPINIALSGAADRAKELTKQLKKDLGKGLDKEQAEKFLDKTQRLFDELECAIDKLDILQAQHRFQRHGHLKPFEWFYKEEAFFSQSEEEVKLGEFCSLVKDMASGSVVALDIVADCEAIRDVMEVYDNRTGEAAEMHENGEFVKDPLYKPSTPFLDSEQQFRLSRLVRASLQLLESKADYQLQTIEARSESAKKRDQERNS
jgi:hypothetical protein